MKHRRLLSSLEAVPAKSQHKKPCSDCPWARTALNGWLGNNTAAEWVQIAHGESQVECHALTGAQCAGIAIYRSNTYKVPRDRTNLRLPRDTKRVFESPIEFTQHHTKDPIMPKSPAEPPSPFEAVQKIMNEVESDTENFSREQYREFLEEIQGSVELRLEAITEDDAYGR